MNMLRFSFFLSLYQFVHFAHKEQECSFPPGYLHASSYTLFISKK